MRSTQSVLDPRSHYSSNAFDSEECECKASFANGLVNVSWCGAGMK